MLVLMATASYRAAQLWRGTTTAFNAWPSEFQRAAPATVWFGTTFLAAGAVLVLGDFGPGAPISIVAAPVAVVEGWPRSSWAHRCRSLAGRAGLSLRICATEWGREPRAGAALTHGRVGA